MSTTETIETLSGLAMQVGKDAGEQGLEVKLRLAGGKPCVLHWGLRQPGHEGWRLPPPAAWPAKTREVGAAAETPFERENGDVVIRLPAPVPYSSLDFVLFFPEQRMWDNNNGKNYRVDLPQTKREAALRAPAEGRGDLDGALKEYVAQEKA